MSSETQGEVRLFRRDDALLDAGPNGIAAHGLINVGFSENLGAGVGAFDRCSVAWTPDYDEVIHILDGMLRLRVGDKTYVAASGDTLFIPRGTPIVYEASVRTTFFYAVSPVQNSISTNKAHDYPQSPPFPLAATAGD